MSGRHWFPFFAKDFLVDKDVESLTDAQFRMLILVWCRCCLDGGVPAEPTGFSKIMGCRKDTAVNMLKMLPLFLERDDKEGGLLVSKRLEKETEKYNKIVERNRINGRKGGRPPKPSGLILGNPKKSQPQPQPQKELLSCAEHEKKPKKLSIADVLKSDGTPDGDKLADRFWRTAKLWEAGKNHKPLQAAIHYRGLYDKGADLSRIFKGACIYYDSFLAKNRKSGKDEHEYMEGFLQWLEQEGWEPAIRSQLEEP